MTTIASEIAASDAQGTDPDATFDQLPLSPEVRRALDEMGFTRPMPVQSATYEPIVSGHDLVVQARTGTGKTAAFGIPLVDRAVKKEPELQALILAPTRELALQSARELARIGKYREVHTAAVYGGASIERQIRELRAGAQIVSGTPGRVLDHLRRGTIDAQRIRVLVLDEADEMLSMGFAKELHAILDLLPKQRQTLLFSATLSGAIRKIGERHMTNPQFVTLSSDAIGALGVRHFVYLVSGVSRGRDLIRILNVEAPESAIIFCNTKSETETVAVELQKAGFDADWLNGDLPQGERETVMGRTRSGDLHYLVATDVAARGIDVSHLSHVFNYTFPDSAEQYIHRTGRTGRAGRTGTAISLISPQELGALYYLRLQYKIFPIERSLPSEREERTRLEAERIAVLADTFSMSQSEIDRAVARRLATHPHGEVFVAGLIRAFFDKYAGASTEGVNSSSVHSEQAPSAASSEDRSEGDDEDHATIYLNVGRRDGVRASEISKLLREQAALTRAEIKHIRIRDKHTFVGVPAERVNDVVTSLSGSNMHDRTLVVEIARSTK